MITTKLLKDLLNTKDSDLSKYDLEQLRLSLGVFRFLVRRLEREVNGRCKDAPLGNVIEEVSAD